MYWKDLENQALELGSVLDFYERRLNSTLIDKYIFGPLPLV